MTPGSLTGFTVGITADRRWREQAALFERHGATVVHGPTIRTLPIGAEAPLRRATEKVVALHPQVLIANTGVGMRSWFANADTWGMGQALAESLARTRIYARGPKASGAVHSAGLAVVDQSRTERLSDLVDLVLEDLAPGERVVMQLDGSCDTEESARLRRADADVTTLPVYRSALPEDREPAVRLAEAVISGRVHAVTFTAAPAVRNLLSIASVAGLEGKLRDALTCGRVVVGCVGPVCFEAAAAEGLASPYLVQPRAFRLGPMVRAVTERLTENRVSVQLDQKSLVLSGNAVFLDGEFIPLTDTESRLLSTLAQRPNAVFAKERLMASVWPGEDMDPHTVEVAIARLRKRLGPHGEVIRSVRRRGYTLRA